MAKILLAEDDELMQKIVYKVLTREKYEVDVATDGNAAFEKLEANNYNYDLVITDLMMPYANGFEIIRKIRNARKEPPVSVIIVSNAGNEDMVMEGFKLGADDFLKKPIIPAELLIRVKRLLNNKP